MSHPFNLRAILGKASKDVLQKVFSRFPSFEVFDWEGLAGTDPQAILSRLAIASAVEQRVIDTRLRQVHALATSAGMKVLLKVSAGRKLTTLPSELRALRNAYQRAFWCLAEYEPLFDDPLVYAYTHSLPKDSRETRIGFPVGAVPITVDIIAELESRVRAAYTEEERAVFCTADHRQQDGVHLIDAYPSDYTDDIQTYTSAGELSTRSVTPPFHVGFYVDEHAGSVTLLAKGGADKHDSLFEAVSQVVFRMPAPPRASKKTYDLSVFKDPHHLFPTDPDSHLSQPRVVKMLLQFPESRHHKAEYKVDPDDPSDNIYDLLRRKLRGGIEELARCTIVAVEARCVYSVPGEAKEIVDFRITIPRWCTLEVEGKEGIIRRHLRPWGIETDGKRLATVPRPARVA